eukprot:NODE_29443_length_446_cov_1.072100.p2 GENE.NODE_29443_length_446_cov_1.072100~~NODE_29443_length_446_cov_1.072100.p2  ORF type:complete len:56 (+),score=4.72 NODE_29443_length_446_cov_1.072100:166-333(+)
MCIRGGNSDFDAASMFYDGPNDALVHAEPPEMAVLRAAAKPTMATKTWWRKGTRS